MFSINMRWSNSRHQMLPGRRKGVRGVLTSPHIVVDDGLHLFPTTLTPRLLIHARAPGTFIVDAMDAMDATG